jgi:hypothetical protein
VSNRRGFIEGTPFQLIADDSLALDAGLERSLPSGGTVGVRASGSFAKNTFAVLDGGGGRLDIDSRAYQGSVLGVFSHPLLGGAGTGSRVAPARRGDDRRAGRAAVAADSVLDRCAPTGAGLRRPRPAIRACSTWPATRASPGCHRRQGGAPAEALAVEQAIVVREQAVLLGEIEIAEPPLACAGPSAWRSVPATPAADCRRPGLSSGPGLDALLQARAPATRAWPWPGRTSSRRHHLIVAEDRRPRRSVGPVGQAAPPARPARRSSRWPAGGYTAG